MAPLAPTPFVPSPIAGHGVLAEAAGLHDHHHDNNNNDTTNNNDTNNNNNNNNSNNDNK